LQIQRFTDLSSPELDPYRSLRTTNLTRFSGRFIAESKPLVKRLVSSRLTVESILVDEKYLEEAVDWLPENSNVLVVPGASVSELIGFDFHRGYLACGLRPKYATIAQLPENLTSRWMGVMLIGVQDPENMGSILRTCAALGIGDILIGPECVDPFARRVLRVSMGNAFKLRFYEVSNPVEGIRELGQLNVETLAACLTDTSQELLEVTRSGQSVVILGNEAHGLPAEVQLEASRCVRIDMEMGTDSLNVSVAAGIILHHLSRS